MILLQARSRGFEACTCNCDCMQSCGKRGCEHSTRDSIGTTIDACNINSSGNLGVEWSPSFHIHLSGIVLPILHSSLSSHLLLTHLPLSSVAPSPPPPAPQVNNTNVDKSVAAIHATVFACLRRRALGDRVYDPATNTLPVLAEEYAAQYAASRVGSKGMLHVIRHGEEGAREAAWGASVAADFDSTGSESIRGLGSGEWRRPRTQSAPVFVSVDAGLPDEGREQRQMGRWSASEQAVGNGHLQDHHRADPDDYRPTPPVVFRDTDDTCNFLAAQRTEGSGTVMRAADGTAAVTAHGGSLCGGQHKAEMRPVPGSERGSPWQDGVASELAQLSHEGQRDAVGGVGSGTGGGRVHYAGSDRFLRGVSQAGKGGLFGVAPHSAALLLPPPQWGARATALAGASDRRLAASWHAAEQMRRQEWMEGWERGREGARCHKGEEEGGGVEVWKEEEVGEGSRRIGALSRTASEPRKAAESAERVDESDSDEASASAGSDGGSGDGSEEGSEHDEEEVSVRVSE